MATTSSDLIIIGVTWYGNPPPDAENRDSMLTAVRTALGGIANLTADSMIFQVESSGSVGPAMIIVKNYEMSAAVVYDYQTYSTALESVLDGISNFAYVSTACDVHRCNDWPITD